MVVKSTYRFEFLYLVLSCIAIWAIYTDSKSILISILFSIPLIAVGVAGVYFERVNSVELLEDRIIFNKIGRRFIIKKGEVRNYWKVTFHKTFIIWLSNGDRKPCFLPLAYSRKDFNAIDRHLKSMYKNTSQHA
jgi:hypothetical protein